MEAFNAGGQLVDSDIQQNLPAQYVQLSVSGSDITRVVLSESGGRSAFVYDDLAFTPIPEPTTLAISIAGIGLIQWRRRRKK